MNKLSIFRAGIVSAIIGVSASSALAKPAIRTPFNVAQPDGTELTIQIYGDEFAHMVLTEDGVPVTQDETGRYVYAIITSDGKIIPSYITAHNPEVRTAAENANVKRLQQEDVTSVLQSNAVKSNIRRNVGPESPDGPAHLKGYGLMDNTFPVMGEQKGLVILVEFSDIPFGSKNKSTTTYSTYTEAEDAAHVYWTDLLNKPGFDGFGGTGSCRDWFLDNSHDGQGVSQFQPQFDLYGPVTLENPVAYYGGNNSYGQDKNPYDMVVEACKALDNEIDFSQYDRDGDGRVDNVYIFYAGFGEADYGGSNTIWPHSFNLSSAYKSFKLDGVTIDHYACSNETVRASYKPDGIGTFVHEFSHVMGLPDLYATDYSTAYTPGEFNVLDYGPYNNDGRTPPNYSSFERFALGWIDPSTILESGTVSLHELNSTNECFYVRTEKAKEYYLMENRQQEGWDKFIPGHGMLIWHVDYKESVFRGNVVNNNSSHQYVDLIEANMLNEGVMRPSKSGHPFPGTLNVTSYDFKSWAGRSCNMALDNISEKDGVITMNVNLEAGVADIEKDGENLPVRWYNLQGIEVSGPIPGAVTIRRCGAESKLVVAP